MELCRGSNNSKARVYPVLQLLRVVDGDTQDVVLDLWEGRITARHRLRLIGVDTPEVRGDEKVAGARVAGIVKEWWRTTGPHHVSIRGIGKYGRPLAYVINAKGKTLNSFLLENKHAVPYCGGRR